MTSLATDKYVRSDPTQPWVSVDNYREELECSCYGNKSHGDYAPPRVHLNCPLCIWTITEDQRRRLVRQNGKWDILPPWDPRIGQFEEIHIVNGRLIQGRTIATSITTNVNGAFSTETILKQHSRRTNKMWKYIRLAMRKDNAEAQAAR